MNFRFPATWFRYVIGLVMLTAACSDYPSEPSSATKSLPERPQSTRKSALTSSLSPATVFNPQYLTQFRRVNAINDAGLVVGDASSNNIGKAWSANGGYVTIGGLDGSTACCSSLTEVNASGVASGWSTTTGAALSMMWDAQSSVRSDVGITGHDSQAHGINDAGAIVGGWTDVFPYQAYYKPVSGPYVQLPLGGDATGGYAFDINESGQVAGIAYHGDDFRAALWMSPSSAVTDLGTLGGISSWAWQVNDVGDVVGWSELAGGVHHAFLWTQSTGMIDLATWPNSCNGDSEAFAINNLGIIVGRCAGKPVVWSAIEGMRQLPIPATSTGGEARDLNEKNQIVGTTNNVGVTLWSIANLPPAADAGGPYSGVEGTAVAMSGAASSDPDNDVLTYSWNFGDPNSAGGGIATGVSPSHTYANDGVYDVSLTVTDPVGATHTATTTVAVSNLAPDLGPLTAPISPVSVGTQVSVSGAFTDPGVLDTHTAIVDWDSNGTSSTSAATVTSENGSGSLIASHTYSAPGVYTIRATVTDDGGAADASLFQYVVVFDPSSGFVTGGGWIDTPAGSYSANELLSGKATFGFVSRYEKGKTVPTGTTEFEFHAASMNFQSTSYEWLVIAGAKAQYKGTGRINGAGSYKFILTATDGDRDGGGGLDRLRMKIWDAASGGLVYDNQRGDPDDASASTELGGGSIVIHQK